MRIRTIKPEWLDDERISLASPNARVLSVALLLMADDEGRGRANPRMLGARVFPGSRSFVEDSTNALRELAEASYVVLYEVDGQSYYQVRNWRKHQRIDRPGRSQLPGPEAANRSESFDSTKAREDSTNVHRTLDEDSRTDRDLDQDLEGTAAACAHAREAAPDLPERYDPKAHVPAADDFGPSSVVARFNERARQELESAGRVGLDVADPMSPTVAQHARKIVQTARQIERSRGVDPREVFVAEREAFFGQVNLAAGTDRAGKRLHSPFAVFAASFGRWTHAQH